MNLFEIANYLAEYLQVSTFSDYCPNGIQVEGKETIKKIGGAVSANLQTIEKAVKEKVDLLIVHHGLFWTKDPYPIVGAKKKKIALLLEHGISLLGYHLPLDAHKEVGNNWKAAFDLGFENKQEFGEYNGRCIGVQGSLKPISIQKFISKLEKYYDHPAATAPWGKKTIKSAALVSGGAYKMILDAKKAGVDCFISGNFDEPAWGMAQEEEIHFLALGHSATEKIGPKALVAHLETQFKIPCVFLDIPNPF